MRNQPWQGHLVSASLQLPLDTVGLLGKYEQHHWKPKGKCMEYSSNLTFLQLGKSEGSSLCCYSGNKRNTNQDSGRAGRGVLTPSHPFYLWELYAEQNSCTQAVKEEIETLGSMLCPTESK